MVSQGPVHMHSLVPTLAHNRCIHTLTCNGLGQAADRGPHIPSADTRGRHIEPRTGQLPQNKAIRSQRNADLTLHAHARTRPEDERQAEHAGACSEHSHTHQSVEVARLEVDVRTEAARTTTQGTLLAAERAPRAALIPLRYIKKAKEVSAARCGVAHPVLHFPAQHGTDGTRSTGPLFFFVLLVCYHSRQYRCPNSNSTWKMLKLRLSDDSAANTSCNHNQYAVSASARICRGSCQYRTSVVIEWPDVACTPSM